jgi:hypothetical protein
VIPGNAFWTQPNAQAFIEISASRIAMAPATELDVAILTDTAFQATEPEGEVYLRLQATTPDETYAVQTPRGLVSLAGSGRYSVVAGDTQHPTLITVVEGSARIEGPNTTLNIGPGQTASISGIESLHSEVGPAQRDGFLTAMLESEPETLTHGAALPPTVAAMPGGAELMQYGTWSENSDYGPVWYPEVAPDWVPYREGTWAYVVPWGWTWVDSDPWGFAPFHYGRWAEISGRWAWIPGTAAVVPTQAYAPALVTFFGAGTIAGIGVGVALAEGRIGWCPLGPREPFHPWYHASDRYFREVNVAHISNFTPISRAVAIGDLVNKRAATVVPSSTMTASRPVARFFQRIDPAQLTQTRPVAGEQPLRPTATTTGFSATVVRRLNGVASPITVRPAPAANGIASDPTTGAAMRPSMPPLHDPAQFAAPIAGPRPSAAMPARATPGSRHATVPTLKVVPETDRSIPALSTPALRLPGSQGPSGRAPNPFHRTRPPVVEAPPAPAVAHLEGPQALHPTPPPPAHPALPPPQVRAPPQSSVHASPLGPTVHGSPPPAHEPSPLHKRPGEG